MQAEGAAISHLFPSNTTEIASALLLLAKTQRIKVAPSPGGRKSKIFSLPWWEGVRGRGRLYRGFHPHLNPLPSRERRDRL